MTYANLETLNAEFGFQLHNLRRLRRNIKEQLQLSKIMNCLLKEQEKIDLKTLLKLIK